MNGGPNGLASPGSGPFASSPVGYFLGGYDGMQGMVVGMDTTLDRLGDVSGTGGPQQLGGGASGGQGESTPGTPRYEIESTFEVKPRIMELHSGYESVGMEQHQWPPHQRPPPLQIHHPQHGGHQSVHQQHHGSHQQHEHEQQQYWGSAAATGFYQ
ncbi:hypothetical protein BD779DRAFT_1508129 [Infundibulicybe gibba]|nr:hypothetical protein BD779DRAFT_1508129 [Infundibulicybe gibba]